MCVRKRVLTEKCGPFDSSIHSADNMQSKNLTFFKHKSNCSQRGMDMSQPQTRMTRQRMVILEELRKVKTHPTADELYAMVRTRMPRISLGTVYRNLDFLTESKEILKLESAGSIRRFDGDTRPHQHVRCRVCGKIGDVIPPVPTPSVEGVSVEGFTIAEARVEYGLLECKFSSINLGKNIFSWHIFISHACSRPMK